jgi:hypothetical protein
VENHVTRSSIESGEIELYYLDSPDADMESGSYSIPGWLFVRERAETALVLLNELPEGHWASSYVVNLTEACQPPQEGDEVAGDEREVEITSEFVNPQEGKPFFGNYSNGTIRLCDEIRLTLKIKGAPDRVSIVTRTSFATETSGYGDAGDIFVPRESSGRGACAQISDYMCDDKYQEGDYEVDDRDFQVLVERMRMSAPKDILNSLLCRTEFRQFPELHNRQFTVQFDANGKVCVDELHNS